jgi:topoisomerase-4 subunit B
MNPHTLKETTLDPRRRTLLRVTVPREEAPAKETSDVIKGLMGNDVQYRFEFIKTRAPKADELDV